MALPISLIGRNSSAAIVAVMLLASALAAQRSTAGERFDARKWQSVKTYNLAQLQELDPAPIGRIVAVKFNYRHEHIRHLKPNWYQGSIWQVERSEGRATYRHVTVFVSTDSLPAFQAISSDPNSHRTYVAYGQVLLDEDAEFPFLRLFGTKVKRNKNGIVTVTW